MVEKKRKKLQKKDEQIKKKCNKLRRIKTKIMEGEEYWKNPLRSERMKKLIVKSARKITINMERNKRIRWKKKEEETKK